MQKRKAAQPLKREEATKVATQPIKVAVDMTPQTVSMTYSEISLAYATLGFIGNKLNPNNFSINTKIRACRRALKDHDEDLNDMIQKLTARMAIKHDDQGDIVRDKDGNFAIKQPDFDIERRTYLRTTVEVHCPVWHPNELSWMQDVTVQGVEDGFVSSVLENLGPLYQE